MLHSGAGQLIAQVIEDLAREHPELPLGPYGRDDEALVWWFLRDRKFEVEETVSKLYKAIVSPFSLDSPCVS